MKKAILTVYLFTGFFIFGIFMVFVFPIIGIAQLFHHSGFSNMVKLWAMKLWASSFYTFGVIFYHKGSIKNQTTWPKGSLIVVSNHNSLLDTPAVYLLLQRFALPLAKIELTKVPVFGRLCSWITLSVNRNSPESRKKAMAEMNRYLSEGGSLVIFPEGKTNKSDVAIQPFEPGAFRLSYELGIPIAPILIRNSRHCLAATKPMILRPGIITTETGPIFSPKDYASSIELQKAIFLWYETELTDGRSAQTFNEVTLSQHL